MSERDGYLQNDPDRAGGLIPDAQGEFVEQEHGGAFDPRAFRSAPSTPAADDTDHPETAPEPPMNDERMAAPGEEIDKARR